MRRSVGDRAERRPFLERCFAETPCNLITPILHHSPALSLLLIGAAVAKSPAAPNLGGVVEWLMAPVLKTGRAQALVGSNPTPSAALIADSRFRIAD